MMKLKLNSKKLKQLNKESKNLDKVQTKQIAGGWVTWECLSGLWDCR
ncbi:MAG: hypothetical protein AAGJ17_02015 [Pseudomonadota bacterium]